MSFEFYEDEQGYISCREIKRDVRERINKFVH